MTGSATGPRPEWDFDYRPAGPPAPEPEAASDVVVATEARVPAARAKAALGALAGAIEVREILARPPLFWLRVRAEAALDPAAVARALREAGAIVRYVAPACAGSQRWAPPLRGGRAAEARPSVWRARPETVGAEPSGPGAWFLGADGGGIDADRAATGTGAGTRLAIIDDDAAGAASLDLDAEILVDVERASRAHAHGARMVAWAVGAPRAEPPFRGVAPDASPRLYLIPKPGLSVVSLPLAVARAVNDGADVIVCATHVEASWSPMLDDALAFAERCGRGGLGAVVVLPTGRDGSSPPGSVHASFSLSFGDPAADPRVLCVAPGARGGGWFFYRDRQKRARPFANRGPSVRLLAPGDDVADPLFAGGHPTHAESSGAAAIAAGVALLVLAQNRALHLRDVFALLETTLAEVEPAASAELLPFADAHDTLPAARDRDGHNAKHGYGALSAAQVCLAAADPVAWALVRIGEVGAARAYRARRLGDPAVRQAYSTALGRWIVRVLLSDARASHAARALVRHARLLSADRRRREGFPAGAFARQVALLLRGLLEGTAAGRPPTPLRAEIRACLARLVEHPEVEDAWLDLAEEILPIRRAQRD